MKRWSLATLALVFLMAAGGEELAQHYERLLAAHDYGMLAAALKRGMETAPAILPTLAWEQAHVVSGGSVFLDAVYALDLLAAGHDGKDAAADAKTRENAVVAALYAIAVIQADGAKCADAAAPAARRRQFGQILAPVWAELRKLPDDTVAADLGKALTAERARADSRPPDDYLCRGRTADISDGLAAGVKEQAPRFVAAEIWLPRQVAARSQLPALLAEFAVRMKRGA